MTLSDQIQLCPKSQSGYDCALRHPQRGSPVLSCHVWFIPFLMMLWLLFVTAVLFIATCNADLAVLWHCGLLLSLPSFSCVLFWRFGEAIRHEHVKSQHCGQSNCSQCLHYAKNLKCISGISHFRLLCDLAVCMGIVMLLSFKMTAKLTLSVFMLQLLLQAGDVETNPGPTFDLVSRNLAKVLDLLLDVASVWYELGLQLGVSENELKVIKHDNDNHARACLREMLSVWLKMDDPCPSWGRLLLSLSHGTVGYSSLSRKIREEFQITLEDVPTRPSKHMVAFEATQVVLKQLFLEIQDPEIVACMLHSVNIVSNEVVLDTAVPVTIQEKDDQLFRSQLSQAMMKELNALGMQDDDAAYMDLIASMDLSKMTTNSKLHRAVVEKLQLEPERLIDVLNILEDNASSDFMKRRSQSLKERHRELLRQLTDQEGQEDTGGILTSTNAISQYASDLKKLYGCHVPPSDEWPPMVTNHNVNLALIKHQRIPKASDVDSFMKSTLHGTVDDIHLEKETIKLGHILKSQYFISRESEKLRRGLLGDSIQQMFKMSGKEISKVTQVDKLLKQVDMQLNLDRNSLVFGNIAPVEGEERDEKGQRVLLDGAPGVGKTTLCHNACKEWVQNRAFTDFKLMVYIPLREKQVANASEIEHLFIYGGKRLIRAVVEELEDTYGEDVLLVFDGWDELSMNQRGKESLLCRIIQRKVLPLSTILITSRPYASQWLRNPKVCSRHIEMFGFTDTQVNQCIRNMLEPEPAGALLQQLEIRSDVKALCYIPMNLAMISYIFTRQGRLPNTLTGIYDSFTNNAMLRYLQDYDSSKEAPQALSNREALPREVKKLYEALCQMAYDGLLKDQMVFTKEELESYHPLLPASSNTLGLLTAFKGFTESGIELHYQFLHLTIQEFLAAEALVQKPTELQSKFTFEHLNDGRFRAMIRFVFGRAQFDDVERVYDFLYATILSVDDESRFLFLCHMLFEAQSVEAIKNVGKTLPACVTNLPFSKDVNLFDAMVIGKFLSFVCAPIKSLNMQDCSISDQEFKMLTDCLSQDCAKVSIEELYFDMRYIHSHDIAPFILHPIFQATTYLEINICNAPEIATKITSAIALMPGLTGLHAHFRPPFNVDNTIDEVNVVLIKPQENPSITVQDLFVAITRNPKITFLKVTEFRNQKDSIQQQLDEKSSEILVNMIETRESTISLHFTLQLFTRSFIEHFSNYLKTSKKVRELSFNEIACPEVRKMTAGEAALLFNALKMNTSLRSLQLLYTKLMFAAVDTERAQALEEMLSTNTSLEALTIKKCLVPALDGYAISKGLLANQTLTELSLENVNEPAPLVDALARNFTISTLQLCKCNLKDEHGPSISKMLQNGSIKSLDLSSNDLGPTGAIGLFTALQSDTVKLEKLYLRRNKLSESTGTLATAVEQALSCNQVLKVLDLDDCSLRSSVIDGMAVSLACNTALESLSLRENNITLLSVWQLFTVLQVNSCLQSLKLRDSINLDSAAMDQLIELLKFNSTLKTLELEFETCFSDEVMFQVFMAALQTNTTLIKLRMTGLENSHLDSMNFDRLKQNLPVLLVRDYSCGRLS